MQFFKLKMNKPVNNNNSFNNGTNNIVPEKQHFSIGTQCGEWTFSDIENIVVLTKSFSPEPNFPEQLELEENASTSLSTELEVGAFCAIIVFHNSRWDNKYFLCTMDYNFGFYNRFNFTVELSNPK